MRTEVLQSWVTVQGSLPVTTVIQEEENNLDVGGCSDVNVWVDLRSVTTLAAAGSNVTLYLDSSPTKDEAFFAPFAALPLLTPSATPMVMRSLPGAASLSPIARWLRWRLVSNSTSTSGTWAATFRIRVSRARTPSFSPMLAPGCQLWLRSDAGVTLNTSGASANIITSWADMSGKGYLFKGVGSPTLGTTTIGGFPAIGTNPNGYLQTSTAGPFIAQPDSLIVVVQSAVASPASYISIFNAGPLATQLQQLFQPVTSDTTVNVNAGTGINQALLSGNLVSAPNILQVDWGASSGSTQIYQNGQSLGAAVAAGAQSTQLGTIGATNAPGQFFTGWFAEILLFQPALTQAWRTLITRYLGARYGIAVP